jgi:RNA polymerase sigma-70 factor (ECF subfamily)
MFGIVLRLLEADQRRVIEMAYLKGMTHMEIAVALGCPLGTVKTIIRRALIDIRNTLAASSESLAYGST